MSKKNFTAVRQGEFIQILCDGKEVMSTCCEYLNVCFTRAVMRESLNAGVVLTDGEIDAMMAVVRNVYDPGKKEIPPYKAPKFRNGEHVRHLKTGEVYVVVGTPSDGYIIERTLEHAYCYKKRDPKNIVEMNRKWIRSQTEMEDGRFAVDGHEQRGGPCGEISLGDPKSCVLPFDGVLTSNEIDRAADKAIEMGYRDGDIETIQKALHACGLCVGQSYLDEKGWLRPNFRKVKERVEQKMGLNLPSQKAAQVSGVSASAMPSGDGGSVVGEILEAVGDIALGALDSAGDVCDGIGECVGGILSGIGDSL